MKGVRTHLGGGVGVLERGPQPGAELAATANPFPGPRPFESTEHLLFFGRARAISDIVALLSIHRTLVVPAPSGTGKTSLMQAGVVPNAREQGFEILPIARVRQLGVGSRACGENENIFVHNVIENWWAESPGERPKDATSLADFLRLRLNRENSPTGRVLVFDQFEELFVLHSDRWRDRAGFFQQIQAALDDDPLLRIVILLRDDYLARLEPFTGLLRDCLRTRYALHGLRFDEAMEAVTKPLATVGRTFGPGVAERFVQNLLEVSPDSVEVVAYQGEYVEPVQLQIVCHMFSERLPYDVLEITEDHIRQYAEVTQALAGFYDRAIKAATRLQKHRREGKVRLWCEKELITPARTRGTVYQGEKFTKGLANDVVAELERHRIIRSEPRGNALWYELTHDRFIEAVLDSNRRWFARQSRRSRRLAVVLLASVPLVALASSLAGNRAARDALRDPIESISIEGRVGVAPNATPVEGKEGQLLTVFDYKDEHPPHVELVAPGGRVIMQAAHGSRHGPLLSAKLPTSGTYLIRIPETSDEAGRKYDLLVFQNEIDPQQDLEGTNLGSKRHPHEIDVPGSISQPNEVDVYKFEGRKGTLVTIGMKSERIDSDLVLVRPDNVIVENDDLSEVNQNSDSLLALTLPIDGTYEVRASASDIHSIGSYDLNFAFQPDPDELFAAGRVLGKLGPDEAKPFRIRAPKGDTVSMRLLPSDNLEVDLHLFGPNGNHLVGSDTTSTRGAVEDLTQSPERSVRLAYPTQSPERSVRLAYPIQPNVSYTLVVTANLSSENDSSDYTLVMESLTTDDLRNDTSAEGKLDGDHVNVYRIHGKGDTLGVMSFEGRGVDPHVLVVAPDGAVTEHDATDTGESEIFTVPFTLKGEYYAFVESASGERGSYSLSFGEIRRAHLR